MALVIGQMIYRYNMKLLWPSLGGVIVLYALILIGNQYPIVLPDEVMGLSAKSLWILLLFVYAAIASLLPVWVLLQPRDYINGLQLFVGLGLLYRRCCSARRSWWRRPSTVSCRPIPRASCRCCSSPRLRRDLRFPRPVASGTTSKQLDKETDARFVGYFGAMGEGMLAGGDHLLHRRLRHPDRLAAGLYRLRQRRRHRLRAGVAARCWPTVWPACRAWRDHSRSDGDSLAGTTMDTGLRLQRSSSAAGELAGMKVNTSVGTLIAVGVCMALAFGAGPMAPAAWSSGRCSVPPTSCWPA